MAASVRPHDQGFALSFIDDSWLGRGTRRTLRPQGEVCPPPRHRRAVMTKQLVRRPDDPGARVHKTRTGRTAVRRRTLRPQGEVCPPPRHRRVLPPHSGARGEVEKLVSTSSRCFCVGMTVGSGRSLPPWPPVCGRTIRALPFLLLTTVGSGRGIEALGAKLATNDSWLGAKLAPSPHKGPPSRDKGETERPEARTSRKAPAGSGQHGKPRPTDAGARDTIHVSATPM